MRLEQLQYVITVADCRSLNRAAKKLYLSQSALSVSIQSLEAEIGFSIFERSSRGMVLTESGQEFYQIALRIQKELNRIPQICRREGQVATVSLHAAPAFCNSVMFPLLKLLKHVEPQIRLKILEIQREGAIDAILYSDADLAVGIYLEEEKEQICRKAQENQITVETLIEDRLIAYLPRNNPFSYEEKVGITQLEETGIRLLQQKDMNSDFGSEAGGEYYCFSERDSILKGVSKGMGYAILPGLMSIDNIYVSTDLVKAVPLSGGIAASTVYLVYPAAKKHSAAEQTVIEKIRAACAPIQKQVNRFAVDDGQEEPFRVLY